MCGMTHSHVLHHAFLYSWQNSALALSRTGFGCVKCLTYMRHDSNVHDIILGLLSSPWTSRTCFMIFSYVRDVTLSYVCCMTQVLLLASWASRTWFLSSTTSSLIVRIYMTHKLETRTWHTNLIRYCNHKQMCHKHCYSVNNVILDSTYMFHTKIWNTNLTHELDTILWSHTNVTHALLFCKQRNPR